MTLFASTLLGVIIFDETLARGDGRLVPAALGLAVALFGVSTLAGEEQPAPDGRATDGSVPAPSGGG